MDGGLKPMSVSLHMGLIDRPMSMSANNTETQRQHGKLNDIADTELLDKWQIV